MPAALITANAAHHARRFDLPVGELALQQHPLLKTTRHGRRHLWRARPMKIKDPPLGQFITQGQGDHFRSDNWFCGTREIHGCPDFHYINRKLWFGVVGNLSAALADPDAPTTHEGDRLTASHFEPVSAEEYAEVTLDLRYKDGEWQQ